MSKPNRCWYCDFFDATDGKSGFCRYHAPNSVDFQTASAGIYVFPFFEDSTVERCGDFKPAVTDPGDPPA